MYNSRNKPSFNRGRQPSRRNFVNPGLKINVNRFISKAEPIAEELPYSAQNQFANLPIDNRIKQNIAQKGFTNPTPIQDQAILPILEGRDVIGLANTGTGKTGAFLIPLINKVLKNYQEKVLIVVPTRELATQIQDDLISLSRTFQIKSAVCIGGANIYNQIRQIRQNPQFVIGTPGRLKDLIERNILRLDNFKSVVLDEADRMLDMGFIPDIKHILSKLSSPRQTLLFSATLAPEIENITRQFQNNPVKISVKTVGVSTLVDQDIVRFAHEGQKIDLLHDILNKPECKKVLIFGQTKHGVEKLAKSLTERGLRSISIHGNKTQAARQKALQSFKSNQVSILVATDVAARGLDIPLVSHVINFDVPATFDEYIHRIGRTGRAGQTGNALTFVR